MRFKAEPNLMVRILKTRPVKIIRFDSKGYFETKNENLAKRLRTRFKEIVPKKKEQ
jgi:hypothetical protein